MLPGNTLLVGFIVHLKTLQLKGKSCQGMNICT